MNKLPCGDCAFYDPILKSGERPSKRGWCIKRSIYPARPGIGQVFPEGARRAEDPRALGEPFIVRGHGVVSECTYARPATRDAAAIKRTAQVRLDAQGKRTLS